MTSVTDESVNIFLFSIVRAQLAKHLPSVNGLNGHFPKFSPLRCPSCAVESLASVSQFATLGQSSFSLLHLPFAGESTLWSEVFPP